MKTSYTLRARGLTDLPTFTQIDNETAKETFLRGIKGLGLAVEDAYSFFKNGREEKRDTYPLGNMGQCIPIWDKVPGAEMIFEVRDLPDLSLGARAVLAGHFVNPNAKLILNNQESCLTAESRGYVDELIEAGLLTEQPADNGYDGAMRYSLTQNGRDFPRALSFEFMREHGNFKLVEKITTADASPSL